MDLPLTRSERKVQAGEWGAGGVFVPLVTPVVFFTVTAGTGREGSG